MFPGLSLAPKSRQLEVPALQWFHQFDANNDGEVLFHMRNLAEAWTAPSDISGPLPSTSQHKMGKSHFCILKCGGWSSQRGIDSRRLHAQAHEESELRRGSYKGG